jgi:hypothetical protein
MLFQISPFNFAEMDEPSRNRNAARARRFCTLTMSDDKVPTQPQDT